jgi:uncharacterized peroxidase-related enzyme
MTFIQTVPADDATGPLQELYSDELNRLGYIANYTQAMSLRPEAILAWRQLSGTIRSKMDLRRYELVTIAAASALRCTYCVLAHGAVLREKVLTANQVAAILRDYRQAGLAPEEVAVMAFAEKITREAHRVTPQDIDTLRGHGLSDVEILDIALAASARNFFSRVLDAVGAEPDAVYFDLALELGMTLGQDRVSETARE